MTSSGTQIANPHWASRFLALVAAIIIGVWLYEQWRVLPGYSEQLAIEKGVYSGPEDTGIGEDGVRALQSRNLGQSF